MVAVGDVSQEVLEMIERSRAAIDAGIGVEDARLPFLKIPNGFPPNDKERTGLWRDNEPSEAILKSFFTPEVIAQRLLICPRINVDMTDDWGIFGYEPGLIFICGVAYEGDQCFNDMFWLANQSLSYDEEVGLPVLPHYDFFPRAKFIRQVLTYRRTPRTFYYLYRLLGQPSSLGEL